MTPDAPVLILGAGMTGLLAAALVKKRRPRAEVIVVERSGHAGAQFRELDLGEFGKCDNAMRMLYETGIAELDGLLHDILPENEWRTLPENFKDVVGVYWRGRLQNNSGYIDLRRLDDEEFRLCEREVLGCTRNGKVSAPAPDAARHLLARFGPTAAGHLTRVLQKLHRLPADALHPCATWQPAMDRVILYDEDQMAPVLKDQRMRAVIAWPQQLTFPVELRPPQAGLYPRRFGMNRVIDAAVQQLERKGVRFLFNRRVVSVEAAGDTVSMVNLDDGAAIERPGLVISANGLPATLGMLRGPADTRPAGPRPPRCWLVFLRTRKPPDMGGLHHFWCFDEPYRTFRVTHYANYCPEARTEKGSPVCVELWSADEDAAGAIARAVRELREMGILEESEITDRAAAPGANLHALNTLDRVRQACAMREKIKERSPRNMITIGPFMEDGMVLLYQIWRRMHPMIVEHL